MGRVVRGGATGIAGKGLMMVVNAISLPITIRYLGPLEYGIWVTISTTVLMLAVLDLGISNTLTNAISRAYADDNEEMARRYFATALWLTAAIAAAIGAAGILIFRQIPWGALFHLSDPRLTAEVQACAAISLAFFLIGLPLNLANKVLSGYQQTHVANYFALLNSVLGLAAVLAVVALKGSLVALTTFYCAGSLAGTAVLNLWLWGWHMPGLRPVASSITRSIARDLFGEGALFFVLQLCGLVVFSSDNLVITHYLGASEVTPYSVTWRLVGYASMLQALLVPSLWPAFSEAYHKRDMEWVRATYRHIMQGSLLAVGSAALLIALLGRAVIRIWAGPAAVPSTPLIWGMALWVVLLSYTVNQAMLLAATARLKLQAVTSTIAAVLNLALSIMWVKQIGAGGVLLATIVSYVFCILAPQAWEVRRILAGRYLGAAEC